MLMFVSLAIIDAIIIFVLYHVLPEYTRRVVGMNEYVDYKTTMLERRLDVLQNELLRLKNHGYKTIDEATQHKPQIV